MISKQSKGISSSKRFHTNSQGVSQCVTMSSWLKSFISSYLIQVFSPRLCLASVFKWAMLFNSVFRKIPSHSMVWATLRKKCHNSLTKQLQPTSKRGQNARKTPLWDQEIACRPPMNWLAWNEPPPETLTENMIFPTSPKHICQQSWYHMMSRSQLRPRTLRCILKSFFSRPGSPVKHYPGWEGNMIKQMQTNANTAPSFEERTKWCLLKLQFREACPGLQPLPFPWPMALPLASPVIYLLHQELLASFHCTFYATW